MRIIAGKHRGRKLVDSSKLKSLRPTTDSNRENLFNILNSSKILKEIGFDLQKANLLDVFCGSGAVSMESLSRGVRSVTLIDLNSTHLAIAKQNAELLKENNVEFLQANILKPVSSSNKKYNFIFLDPPYSKDMAKTALKNLNEASFIADKALIIIEHSKNEDIELDDDKFTLLDKRKYGIAVFSFYQKN